MTPTLLLALLLQADPLPRCFHPSPPAGSVPAARLDTFVRLQEQRTHLFRAGDTDGRGRSRFVLTYEPPIDGVRLSFARSLGGAKVDVTAVGPEGRMTLLREARTGGDAIELDWGPQTISRLDVVVHHHLRQAPVLDGWTSTRRVQASATPAGTGCIGSAPTR